MKVLPLFKSHYSLGRSTLTLDPEKSSKDNGPDSIIDLALTNNLKEVILVDDSISGFLEAYKSCSAAKLQLIFGLRISFCPDVKVKSDEELKNTCKFIIFAKNTNGYKRLIKISTLAFREENFYYESRLDFKILKELWSEEDLQLGVPFYDSFLFKNLFTFSTFVPDFSYAKPIFFTEDNDLPFDARLAAKVEEYKANYEVIPAKSIYYAKRDDFLAYLTFRCINNRTTLDKPELDHMTSTEFCLEAWKEVNG